MLHDMIWEWELTNMAARSSLNPLVLRISYDELVAFADELDRKKEKSPCKEKTHAEPEEADEKPAKKVAAKTNSNGHVVSKNSHKKGIRRKESEKLESSDKSGTENARKEAKKQKKSSSQAKEKRKSSASEHSVGDVKDTTVNSDEKKKKNNNPEKCDEEVQTKIVLNGDEKERQDYELNLRARTGGVLRLSNAPIHAVDDEDLATSVNTRGIIRLPEGFQLTNHETALEKDEFCTPSEELNERDEGEVFCVQNTPRKQIKDTFSSKLYDRSKGDCCDSQQDCHMDQVSREIVPNNRVSETVYKTAPNICMGNEQTQSPVEKRMKTLNLRQAQKLIKLVSQKQLSLSNLLSHDMLDKAAFQKIMGYSKEIQEFYKAIMMLDLSFAVEEDVDQSLWKNGFYQIIETFRKYGKLFLGYTDKTEVLSQEETNDCLKEFLESAEAFYKGLLESLQKTHQLSVQDVIKQPRKIDQLGKNAKLALRSSHHILICLGDIKRYQSQFQPSQNWAAIRSWYLKASKLAPKNGKPYNLLAVVAVYANCKLDAVYYYVRSLSVSNPILTAREALTNIYHDIQKRADRFQRSEDEKKKCMEQKRNQAQNRSPTGKGRGRGRSVFGETARGAGLMSEHSDNNHGRYEVWIFLRQESYRRVILTENGQVQDVDITGQPISENKGKEPVVEEVKELPKISLQEVNRMFVLHFLCAHGLLYTRIGMERLPALQYLLIGEFHTLLDYPASAAVSHSNLLQMMAINMFAIENTAVLDSTEQYVRVGTPQDQAMNLAVEMFINLVKCCCDLLRSISTEEQYLQAGASDMLQGLSAPLRQFLPAIKVFTDWLISHVNLWQASSISTHRVLWESVAQFVNAVAYLDIQNIIDDDGDHMVTLLEDEFLAGFKPLSGATKPLCRVKSLDHKDLAEDNLRCQLFKDFAAFLVSLESPPLEFDEETGQFSAMIKSSPVSPAKESPSIRVHLDTSGHDHEDSDDDVIIESIEDEVDSGDEMERGLKELKAKKDALKKQVEVHKEREDKAKAVIREHISKPQLMLENYPTYLVPDTNCFVDHMNGLRAIVACQAFTLVVPLIVINELDGLKRELHVDKFHDLQHAQYVLENARCAIDFLEFEFSRRNPQMKAVTSKGSELDTIAFRSEDPSGRRGKGCNDDIILSCCLHYCEENFVNRLATANQPITIQRKVVLLTDDRNLRVKAYTRNVPVLTVQQFRKMARL